MKTSPGVTITGFEGRRGQLWILSLLCKNFFFLASFEIKINDILVHSKLSTMAFPDYEEVGSIISEVSKGNPVRQVTKQQPINCTIFWYIKKILFCNVNL